MRETVIRCDGCGETVPRNDGAHYTVQLICVAGPSRDPVQPAWRDLCGYCASLVRAIVELQEREQGRSRPISVDVAARGPNV